MRGERAAAKARPGLQCVPEKEVLIDPINPRGELALLDFHKCENRAYLTQSWSVWTDF
jgi:hypothetical protein